MNSINGLDEMDLATLAESYELECKAAQGRDGRGELPEDVWKSYSAMANADGGVILLGVQEKPVGTFRVLGLADVERVLKGFDFTDLDLDTVAAYRNRFAAVKPGHVWTDLPLPEFLERIGAFGKNREDGFVGMRLAGLLMFGRAEVIRDAFPHYMVDYQERLEAKAEKRWIDRLVPDGSWSGNVYDFFRKVYPKLTADLKVPFQLRDGQRIEDTPVHEALREALVNTLIHADYSGRVSVLVFKRPDMYGFRNPGRMRIPAVQAIQGGSSDCRNRRLQVMFQLVGYGDHAGSGLPKIYTNWKNQHWRSPLLYELAEPEQTLMELRMSSLVPDTAVTELTARLGERFTGHTETARLALITAQVEGVVSHDRLKQICTEHPADLTKMLGLLVREGLLASEGSGRGMTYRLPWQRHEVSVLFDTADASGGVAPDRTKAPELDPLRPELDPLRPELDPLRPELDPLRPELGAIYLDWSQLSPALQAELTEQSLAVSARKRVAPALLQEALLRLCTGRYLGIRVLAHILKRDADALRKRTLTPMVKAGRLKTAYPALSDPRQAYSAAAIDNEKLP